MWTQQEKTQCVARFIESPMLKCNETLGHSMEGNQSPDQLFRLGIRHSWKQIVFSINRGLVTHLFQILTLHLGIGLCLYEPGYTLNFLLWRPHFSSNLHLLENKRTL
ncbi:hypothetical protein AVEN_101785-1 [Araneus ventricosus]|uniref:Uncharacterized protein n=1 Tax=Araneus ventricosus TaxID=182803 RepID=A0A4Y2CZA7_ARAVE|nr:hypothetical protein AVEN_101785-1 [Araneus ventricosus]